MNQELKYVQVKDILTAHIRKNRPVGSKLPSTAELQQELGVSKTTVNRAIKDLVDEGHLERFRRRGTFVARGNKNRVFLWLGAGEDICDPHRDMIMRGAAREAQDRDEHLLVRGLDYGNEPIFTGTKGTPIAGAILLYNSVRSVVDAYHAQHIPVVMVTAFVRFPGVPFVMGDHFGAGYEATDYLTRHGHKKIVHVTIRSFPFRCTIMDERILGYREAMHQAGLGDWCDVFRTPIGMMGHAPTEDDVADDKIAVREFLAMLDQLQPTACTCFDDLRAEWVIRVCHNHNIRIPEDLSVIGVNDDGHGARVWPALTTVSLHLEEHGQSALRMLDTMIEEARLTGGGEVLPATLVERDSVKVLVHEDKQRTAGN